MFIHGREDNDVYENVFYNTSGVTWEIVVLDLKNNIGIFRRVIKNDNENTFTIKYEYVIADYLHMDSISFKQPLPSEPKYHKILYRGSWASGHYFNVSNKNDEKEVFKRYYLMILSNIESGFTSNENEKKNI